MPSELHSQTTIWTEDFTGETGSSSVTLVGDQWSATHDTGASTGNKTPSLNVGGGEFTWTGPTSGNAGNYVCVWTSDPIDATGYSDLLVTYATAGDGTHSYSVSSSDPANTTITITFTILKNESRSLDDVQLTGTASCTPTTWYADADGDGLGDSGTSTSSCDQPADYVADNSDLCDDNSACNYDANSTANAVCTYGTMWYADADGDGLGDAGTSQTACTQPTRYVAGSSDLCDDNTACNYDANSTTNASCSYGSTWYADSDGDGLGDACTSQTACSQPAGYVAGTSDLCDDNTACN